ncbi:hypothetical protein RJ55_07366 [Drechmeria coniospora]|nr:hypothetical protein RJ55_07366 [Drechmeria coniospora]
MSSAPLLSSNFHGSMRDHPAFLRVCHSPWLWMPQNVLVALRGFFVAYLLLAGAMMVHYKLNVEEPDVSRWCRLFDFALIGDALVFVYHVLAFCWTFTHLYHPDPDVIRGRVASRIVEAMSLPRNMASLRKQFYLTMFYTTATCFSFMNTTIYWFVTRPHDAGSGDPSELMAGAPSSVEATHLPGMPTAPFGDLLGGAGWFEPFMIGNLYGVVSAIMVVEIMMMNTIKRPLALGFHVLGLLCASVLYLGWAALGRAVTGDSPFFWLDEDEVGSKMAVATYCVGFVLMSQLMFILMQGLVGIREGLYRSLGGEAAGH